MFEDTQRISIDEHIENIDHSQEENNNQSTNNQNYIRLLPLSYEEYTEPSFPTNIFAHNSFIVLNRYLVTINGRCRNSINHHAFVLDLEAQESSWIQLGINVSPEAQETFPRASASMCIVPSFHHGSLSLSSSSSSSTSTSTNAIESSNIMQEYGTTGRIFIFGGWKDLVRFNTFLTINVTYHSHQNKHGQYRLAPTQLKYDDDDIDTDDDDDDEIQEYYADEEFDYMEDDDEDLSSSSSENECLAKQTSKSLNYIRVPPFTLSVEEEKSVPGSSMVKPRIGASCVLWHNVIYVFGGKGYGNDYFNDMYAYHIESDKRYWEKMEYAANSPVPPSRFHHTAHVNSQGQLFIFFGRPVRSADVVKLVSEAQSEEWSVVWKFDINSRWWTKIYGIGDVPSPRSGHCSINITDNYFLILGGVGKKPFTEPDSFYIFDAVSETWRAVEPYRRVSYGYRAAVYVPHLKSMEKQDMNINDNNTVTDNNNNNNNNNNTQSSTTPINSEYTSSTSSKTIISKETTWKNKLYQDQISIFYYGEPSIHGAFGHPLTRLRIPMALFSSYRSDMISMWDTKLQNIC